jgi:hypothetical protein
MIRKSVFWGLAIVLLVVLINLIVRGRQLEKKQANKSVEIVQESPSSPTRVLRPKGLEVKPSKMRLEKDTGSNAGSLCAWHQMEIRNNETTSYGKIQLGIDYIDRKGKVLAARSYSAAGKIAPGEVLRLADVKIEGLPVQTADCRIAVIYAEMDARTGSK